MIPHTLSNKNSVENIVNKNFNSIDKKIDNIQILNELNNLRNEAFSKIGTVENVPFYDNDLQSISNRLIDYQDEKFPCPYGNITAKGTPKSYIDMWKAIIKDTGLQDQNKYDLLYKWLDFENGLAKDYPEVIIRIAKMVGKL